MKQLFPGSTDSPTEQLPKNVSTVALLFSVAIATVVFSVTPAQAITNAHAAPKSQDFYKSDGALLATLPFVGTIFICSVVEITPHLALTASHCITSLPSGTSLYVAFGSDIACGGESTSAGLSAPSGCQDTVSKSQVSAFVPGGAGTSSYASDIALLQSTTKSKLGGSHFPRNPPSGLSRSKQLFPTVAVFGWTSGGSRIAPAYVPTLFSKYGTDKSVSDSTLFLQERPSTTSPIGAICNGDSGGANYVSNDGGKEFYLAALTSTGPTSDTTSCTWPNLSSPIDLPSVQRFLAGLKTNFKKELTTWLTTKGVSESD